MGWDGLNASGDASGEGWWGLGISKQLAGARHGLDGSNASGDASSEGWECVSDVKTASWGSTWVGVGDVSDEGWDVETVSRGSTNAS